MVKFIATDLDGTLLDADGKLPKEIFPLIEEMHRTGILFAPASGRQYASLKQFFAPVEDKIVFICENGALVKYRGKTIHLNPIPESRLKEALDEIRALDGLYPMLCGTDFAYIENDETPFYEYSMHSYANCKKVQNLNEVLGSEAICKIAVWDRYAAAEHCIQVLPERIPLLKTTLSGFDWCDVASPTASKGEAIQLIQREFHLKKEECVAFGDHMNDYEMLLACGTAFVTYNAYPPLKKLIKRVIPSNREGGVIAKIREILVNEREELF